MPTSNPFEQALEERDDAPASPAAPANPFEQALDERDRSTETRMRRSFASSADISPDTAAEARQIALRTGTPADVVERNFDEYKKKSLLEQPYKAMQDQTPKLASWLEKPENAKVAKDDLEQLGFLEWVVSAWPRAISQTINQQRYSGLRYKEVHGGTLSQADHDLMESYRYNMEKDGTLGTDASWFRGALTGTARFFANQAPIIEYGVRGATYGAAAGLGASLAAGPGAPIVAGVAAPTAAGAGLAMGLMYGVLKSTNEQEAVGAYDEFINMRLEHGAPLDPTIARAAALAVGLINAPIEAGAQELLLKSIPGFSKLTSGAVRAGVSAALRNPTVRAALFDAAKSYATTLAGETGQEVGQRAVTILLGELSKAVGKPAEIPGQVEPGNINLFEQPAVKNPDGTVSTVDSLSVNIDGKEILLPTVTAAGEHFTGTMEEKTKQAINEYKKTGRHLGTFATPEAATAFAEQLHKDYAAGTYDQANKYRAPGSIATDLLEEAAGALQGFALGVLPGPAASAMHATRQARAAQANVQIFTALGEGVQASKTMKRAPDAAQSFLEHATKDGPVKTLYVPVGAWTQYWQDKGIDPAAIAAEVTGSRDEFERATKDGPEIGEIAIPTARYATKLAGTEHNAFLAQELRLKPGQMNGREAAAYLEEEKQKTAAAAAEPAPAAAEPTSIIRQQVVTELQGAGVAPATADKYANLYESAFGALGQRAGVDPAALYARYGLTVNRPGLETPDLAIAQPALQESASAAPTFDALIADPTPEEVQQLERRQTAVPPPAGVERRGILSTDQNAPENQPINSMANLGGAVAKMLSEDPSFLQRLAVVRRGAAAAPREKGAPAAKVDNNAPTAQTTGDDAGAETTSARPGETGRAPIRRVEESAPIGRESSKQRTARRERHYADVFSAVLDAARQIDPAVNPDALHKEVNDRLELLEELDADYAESGESPRQLLEAIAQAGGISLQAEQAVGALSGELRWIRQSEALGPFGSYGGVRGVFQKRDTRGGSGLARAGLSLDDMLTSLQQDQRFAYLETIGDLLAALEDVARLGDVGLKGAVKFPGTDELARRAGIKLNTAWWEPESFNQDAVPPSAVWAGFQEDEEHPAGGFPLYNVVGGRLSGSTVAAATLEKHGIPIPATPQQPAKFTIERRGSGGYSVLDNTGKEIGRADVVDNGRGDYLNNVRIDKDWQRQGIGTALYAAIEKDLGRPLRPSPTSQTPAVKAFWEKRNARAAAQPALPGAEAVRGMEIATPEMEAPFALTPEVAKRKPVQGEFFQSVFHGSPHQFEKFSLQAIGTGEGHQAYGWGLYFASKREVAQRYRDTLTSGAGTDVQVTMPDGTVRALPIWIANELKDGNAGEVIADFEARIEQSLIDKESSSQPWNIDTRLEEQRAILAIALAAEQSRGRANTDLADIDRRMDENIAALERGDAGVDHQALQQERNRAQDRRDLVAGGPGDLTIGEPGRLYHVNIPEDEDYLDWDRPASKQSPKVQAALRELGVTWDEFKPKTIPQFLRWFETKEAQRLWREDIGIRESLQRGFLLAEAGDVEGLNRWQEQKQGYFSKGMIDPTGQSIYEQLQWKDRQEDRQGTLVPNAMRRSAERVSRALNEQGVAGIRYLDGVSRTSGVGSSNYVVFDDQLVEVLEFFQSEKPTLAPDGTYQTDLFGAPLEESLPPAEPTLQRDDVEGDFPTRTQLVTQRERTLGAAKVQAPEDAARALAYLARGAQERFDALVTDADGIPIGIVGSFKGALSEAPVYTSVITAEAFRITGAANIWFVHNHPSGSAKLSPEDRSIAMKLETAFAGTAITPHGIIAIGSGEEGKRQYQHYQPVSGMTREGTVKKALTRGPSVPVLEREFATTGKLGADKVSISTPERALLDTPKLAAGRFGVLMLDAQNVPIGFLPVDPEHAQQLRQQGRLDWLYRALSISAPSSAIIYVATAGAVEARAAVNLANALSTVEVRTLDVIGRREDGSHMSTSQATGGGPLGWKSEFQQEKRGVIRFGAGRKVNIELFAKADLSTFLHETGHFFLEVARDLANDIATIPGPDRTFEQQQLFEDLAAIDDWTADEADATAKHEKFARGFEAYLMKGVAPSLQLRGAFARFKAWLTGIYKSLKRLDVELSPEITAVFDRLLASDQAIADAHAEAAVTPIFLDAAAAGMTQGEFALYRKTIEAASRDAQETLQTKLLAEVEREKTAEWKARRAAIRLEVETEIHARREYQALAGIQYGTQPNGDPLVAGQDPTPLKLSRQAIVDQFGKGRLKLLPKPYVYTSDGGLEPSTAAELFGFSSADELLTALAKAGNMTRAIETETDRRMIAEHGSLLLDGSIQERAQAAAANDTRDQVVRAELKALINLKRLVAPHVAAATQQATRERAYERRWLEAESKLKIAMAEGRKQVEIDELQDEVDNLKRKAAGGPALITSAIPSQAVIVQAARERIAGTRVRQIQPERFWSAARKAQQAAVRAAAKQDFDAAITAQTQQLLNLALYREAEKALDEAEQRVRRAKDLTRPATRSRLGLAGHGLLEQIDGILERYEFKAISGPAEQRRASLRKWIAALEGENLPIELSDEVLDDARRINYAELTYDEFVGVTDGLQQLAHLAGVIGRRLQAEAHEDFVAIRDGMVGHIEEHGTARPTKLEILPKDRRVRIVGEWIASHTKLSQMVQALDGYVDGGPVWSALMRPINEAATKQQAMHEAAATAMKKILTDHYTGRELAHFHDLQRIDAIGESLSKEGRIAVALNWGNEGNRQRLMESGTRKWNTRQVQAILDTLDARDLRFVQASLDYINSYWEQIAAKQTRVFGVAPEKIAPASWTHSQYGEQRGGYYPIAYDGRLLLRQGNIIDADQANLQKHANYAYATTKRGHTKAREEKVNAPVRLELGVMYEHVEAVIHDLTHHEMLIDVGRLMGDGRVQKAIQSRAGDIVYRQMRGALLDIALGLRHQSTSVGKAINYVKNGTTIAGLGWNVWTAAQQPLGIFNGAARIGPKWVAKGIGHIFRDASALEYSSRWVREKSEMMRLRGSTQSREIADLRSNIKRSGSWFDNALRTVTLNALEADDITETFLFLIEKTQQVADLPIWIGGYEKAIAAGETEATAVALADQYVLDSQSGGQIKDLAQVQRGDALFKVLTAFYSYGNLIFNQTARTIGQTNFRKVGSVGQMLGNLLLIYVAPAAMTVALSRAFGKSSGDDPDDFVVDMGKEVLATAMNTMVLVRELGNLAANVYAKQTGAKMPGGARGYEGPTGFRFFSSLYRLGEQATQGEIDRAFIRAVEDVAGVLFHLPVPQVQRSIDGWVALEEGRTHNPLALLTGAPPKPK